MTFKSNQTKKNDLKIFIIQSADRKIDFDEIIEQKNISGDELLDEIENIVNSGTKINIDYHIDEILDQQQQEEIKNYFMKEAKMTLFQMLSFILTMNMKSMNLDLLESNFFLILQN